MASGPEDAYSFDLTALVDYEPDRTTAPQTIGVGGGRLNTPPQPPAVSPGIGVGTTNTSPSILSNVTVGVGGTRALQQQAGGPPTPSGQGYLDGKPIVAHKSTVQRRSPKGKQPAARAMRGAKEPRRTTRQNTPSSPSDAGSLRRSSASDSSGSGSRRGSGSGGGGGGGGDDDDEDDDGTPSVRSGPSSRRRARCRILDNQEMEQQLIQILQDQCQIAAGRRIAGITTTNTITTTYKNGRRPTVTRRSTSVRN